MSTRLRWSVCVVVAISCRAPQATQAPPAQAIVDPVALSGPPSDERASVAIDATNEAGAIVVTVPKPKPVAMGSSVSVLSQQDTARLLARLEPLPDLGGQPAPVSAPSSPPPPAPGTIQPIAFEAPVGKAVTAAPIAPVIPSRPLVAPTISPSAEVRAESEIRIRFDEPMIAVAAVGTAAHPPISIEPAVTGTWRWIDTRVLQLTVAPRLPMATEFVVTVPAGTRALSGATLATPAVGKFSTPPPAINSLYPNIVLRPDSPLAVVFDQDIDPDRIAPLLSFARDSKAKIAVKVISLADARALWAKHPQLTADPTKALGKSAVIVVPVTGQWPAGGARAFLAKGAPSREGPRVSTTPSDLGFTVAGPFTLEGLTCREDATARIAGQHCPAVGWVRVQFSNSIAESSFHADKVQIDGTELQDTKPASNAVMLTTPDPVGRLYTISVGDGLVDEYGQPFIGNHHASFTTTPEVFDTRVQAPTGLVVLDPRYQIPQWEVTGEALASMHVQLYRVTPADYFAYAAYERHERRTPPGTRVYANDIAIGPRHGVTARVDLRPALSADGLGHVIAIASYTAVRGTPPEPSVAWIQVTKLGVTARVDGDHLNAWVHDITPARFLVPETDVATSLVVDGQGVTARAPTDKDGHAMFALAVAPTKRLDQVSQLLVTTATDSTFQAFEGAHWRANRQRDARWYVTDDRFTYKPGEPLYIKGWLRWSDNRVNPDIAVPDLGDTVDYDLVDARGNKLAHGTSDLTDVGGFDATIDIPANAALGYAQLTVHSRGASHVHPIAIQEFRRPAFSVSLDDDVAFSGTKPVILGDSIEMRTEAKYYAGGGLAGGGVDWVARLEWTTYQPPGWERYRFEPKHPRRMSRYDAPRVEVREHAMLSGASTATSVFGIAALPLRQPAVLSVDANVTDLDRMTIRAGSRPILVHPSSYYVGMREHPGSRDQIDLIVTDIDGKAIAGVPIDVAIEGVLGSERYRDDAKIADSQHCKTTSAATPVSCGFKRTDDKLAYTAIAQIADRRGRVNSAQYAIPWYQAHDSDDDLQAVADRSSYKPGDVAKIEIRSKVSPAIAVVSFARQGVIDEKRVELTKPSTIVELPIDESFIENVVVLVDRWGKRRRPLIAGSPPLPELTSTTVDLHVDVASAHLVMTARPLQSLVEPGDTATFEVDVQHDGAPVRDAEVALMVVDEAVLALSNSRHEDPLASFYRTVNDDTTLVSTLPLVDDAGASIDLKPGIERFSLEGRGWGTIGSGSLGGMGYGAGGGSGGISTVVTSRKDFRANAAFSPRLRTDETGKVRLTVKMPDSLTRFRVVAIAASGSHHFGKAEGTIVTQRKINARTIAPRFVDQGDSFSVPVLVQNLDSHERTIDVAVRAANLVATGPQGKRVTVPGGQRAEVRFDMTTKSRGPAVIQTIAVSGTFADASNVTIPVYEPATTESFATYGTVDDASQFERVVVPQDVFPEVGGVEVELASTQLQSLTDAYWYLYAYPYECAEQRSARMLATTAVMGILDAFETPGRPTKSEIEATAKHDLAVLAHDQRADGGWGYFGGMKSDPYVTMQVFAALVAQHAGGTTANNARAFITKLERSVTADLDKAAATPAGSRHVDRDSFAYPISLAAFALASLGASGIDVRPRAMHLHDIALALGSYPIDAKARLLALVAKAPAAAAMRARLMSELVSAIHETAASATVATTYVDGEQLVLPSSTKTTALVLDAMMREAPAHTLITKLAHGVLEARRHGRWVSTQENLYALAAMRRYFDTYEKATPNFTGKLWFGHASYAEQAFVGRSSARADAHVDWTTLAPGSSHDVAIVKDGPGRMYYRLGITYAPKRTDLPALDSGFIVRRSYAAVDDPKDVVHGSDGRWHIKLGARVVVTIETLNTTQRHGVAIADPLPAGFEAVNDNLATAERAVLTHDDAWDYRDARDTRMEAFSMDLAAGTHRLSYTARATTPGTFAAAPAKAEEMYAPETFGRSNGETIVIE
jgi:hypothetical protein